MRTDYKPFIEGLEAADEEHVSFLLSAGYWSDSDPKKKWVSDWLQNKSSLKRDAREEETLAVAKAANRVAEEANDLARSSNAIASEAKEFARLASISASEQARWAMWAAIIATIAIIIAAMAYINS